MTHNGHSTPLSPETRVRVAVVGAGQFGRLHALAYRNNRDTDLVAIINRDLAKAQRLADEVGAPHVFSSLAEALDAVELDAVSLVTSPTHQPADASLALSHGLSVLAEKPLALSSEAAAEIADAATTTGGLVMPAHILRFAAPYQELKGRVDAGTIGTPRALSFRRHRTADHDAQFGAIHPVLMTMVHDIDLALWLCAGTPTRVTARQVEQPGRNQPTVVWAEVLLDSGAIWSFQVSWAVSPGQPVPDSLEIVGDDGLLTLSLTDHLTGPPAAAPFDDVLTPAFANGALNEEIRVFIDGVRTGIRPTVVTLDDALTGLGLAEQIVAEATRNTVQAGAAR